MSIKKVLEKGVKLKTVQKIIPLISMIVWSEVLCLSYIVYSQGKTKKS